jgi:hypothetical protein
MGGGRGLLATSGNVTAKGYEKFIDSGKLLRSADVDRNGTRIKIGMVTGTGGLLLVSDVIKTLCHT